MSVVYPNCVSTVLWNGGRIRLRPDQVWESDDPFVVARPEFFTSASSLSASSPGHGEPVERATRAPGERRAVKRPAKPDAQ